MAARLRLMPDRSLRPGRHRLRVASYNIHRALGFNRRQDAQRIGAVIAELDADIVGLQAVDWHQDTGASPLGQLTRLPGYEAAAAPNICRQRGEYGNLLLSRGGVDAVRRIDLTVAGWEARGAIDADLRIGGRRLRVVVTHFGLRMRERWDQAARLRRLLTEPPERPAILLGDFNDWLPGSPSLQPLLRCCAAGRRAARFPAVRPVFALDRIFVYRLPVPAGNRVHASPLARHASDHLPVVAEVELPD